MAPQEWLSGLTDVTANLASFLPVLLGAAVLVLAGWLLGRVMAWVAGRTVGALMRRLAGYAALRNALEWSNAAVQVPRVIAGFVFWLILVFFVAAAMETLGLPVVTASLSRIAYYLPNVLAALLVVFVGVIGGKVIGGAVARMAGTAGVAFGPTVAGTVQGTVILVAAVVALEQVGIEADILIVIVAIVIGATLTGAGLAFGLGARTAVSNIIASHYVAQSYRVGQTIRVAGVEGKIVQTTPTAVFLAVADGRVMIPAKRFSEEVTVLVTEA
ncbi:MAG: hypothetical protein WEB90_05605 [Gemmatimonadota bacterium]